MALFRSRIRSRILINHRAESGSLLLEIFAPEYLFNSSMQSDPDQYDLLSISYALVYLDFSISVERTAELTAIIATAAAAAVPAIKKNQN